MIRWPAQCASGRQRSTPVCTPSSAAKAKKLAGAVKAIAGWVPGGTRGPAEDRTADEALYAEQQAHMADAVAKLRAMALGE